MWEVVDYMGVFYCPLSLSAFHVPFDATKLD